MKNYFDLFQLIWVFNTLQTLNESTNFLVPMRGKSVQFCRSAGLNMVKCVNTKLLTVGCKPEKLAKILVNKSKRQRMCKTNGCLKSVEHFLFVQILCGPG